MSNNNVKFYHPSKTGKGFACSFKDSKNNDCVFASILKQSGWDENTKTGTFKASRDDINANVTIKLNDLETANIIDAIERGRPLSTFHDGDVPKTIQFVPWFSKTAEEDKKPEQRGFSFSITITNKEDANLKNSFFIGLNFSEARLLREYLVNCLNNHFNFGRSEVYTKISNQEIE